MSYIGKNIIRYNKDIEFTFLKNTIKINGPLGTNSIDINHTIICNIDKTNKQICIYTQNNKKYWGTVNKLISNAIEGVVKGFEHKLELVGLGYKFISVENSIIKLDIGYSNVVNIKLPKNINIVKWDTKFIIITSVNKRILGEFTFKLFSIRKYNKYKGKGLIPTHYKLKTKESKR